MNIDQQKEMLVVHLQWMNQLLDKSFELATIQ